MKQEGLRRAIAMLFLDSLSMGRYQCASGPLMNRPTRPGPQVARVLKPRENNGFTWDEAGILAFVSAWFSET